MVGLVGLLFLVSCSSARDEVFSNICQNNGFNLESENDTHVLCSKTVTSRGRDKIVRRTIDKTGSNEVIARQICQHNGYGFDSENTTHIVCQRTVQSRGTPQIVTRVLNK